MDDKVCICGGHLAKGYSGGRYHAWILGEALNASGASVTLWTNALPQYATDFEGYPGHERILLHVDAEFMYPPQGRFDWVIVIPDRNSPIDVYERWLCLAYRCGARVALLNFESPNWFNALSGSPADPKGWSGWTLVSRYCDLILSSAEESSRYAREFYTEVPDGCEFTTCPPAINSHAADSVNADDRRNQICVITRLGGGNFAHKGGYDLAEVIGPELKGVELVFLVGISSVQDDILAALTSRANEHGVRLRFLGGADDCEKFLEIKRSRLMLFLSRFEGFGYPPVEALYCGTPCIVYELPVLREISGDGLIYVAPGDFAALRCEIQRVLQGPNPTREVLRAYVSDVATFESFVCRLTQTFRPESKRLPIKHLALLVRLKCRLDPIRRPLRRRLSDFRRMVVRLVKGLRVSRRGL